MNTQLHHKRKSRLGGFTLIEVVIALGLMGMLAGMIFRVARTSMQLSQIVVEEQNVTMEQNSFFNLLKTHFEQIPGNAVIRLESSDSRGGGVSHNLFILTFQNVPMSFNWGETRMTAEAIEMATIEQRDGFIDVVLRFYDEEILQDSDSTGNDDVEPVAEIVLIENLWMCDCEVIDGNTMEQFTEWDNSGKLPLQVKFYCRFDPTSDIVQQTFWIVPKQNPEVLFRQIMQQNSIEQPSPPGDDVGRPKVPPVEVRPGLRPENNPAKPGNNERRQR